MLRLRLAVVGCALALVAGSACADSSDELSAKEQRYCELTGELEGKGEEVFGSLSEEPSAEELAAAEKRFADEADAELDELVETAPDDIAADVAEYVEGIRARGRGEDSDASDEKILEWEEANCGA